MESNVNAVLFIYGRSAITLRWDSKLISHEMAMDTIDNIGKRFLTHFQGTILQFKVTENQDENGNIISITGIVLNLITPIYVIVIDGTRHMYDYNKVNYKQLRITSDQVFSKHESYLITEDGNFIIDRDIIISSMSSFQEMPKMLPDNNKKTRRINIEELKAHNTRQDC